MERSPTPSSGPGADSLTSEIQKIVDQSSFMLMTVRPKSLALMGAFSAATV